MANGYDPINWENNITPLSAENLNKMDRAIDNLYDNMQAWTELQTKLPEWKDSIAGNDARFAELNSAIEQIEPKLLTTSFDSTTGTLKIKLKTT